MDAHPTAILVIVLVLLSCVGAVSFSYGNPNAIHCRAEERKALLEFKKGLKDPSNRLSSWVGEDCCRWRGIRCDNTTSHILHLNLANPFNFNINDLLIYDLYDDGSHFDAFMRSRLGGNISGSLLQLKHLRHLDLSRNDFGGLKIPDFFGSLASLTYLDLSSAGFGGSIPPQIGNLSSLRYLDLVSNFKDFVYGNNNDLYVTNDDVRWISHLTSIEFLDMSFVDLSQASSNWLQVISMLPSLSTLHLSNCSLGNTLPLSHANFSSLSTLDLSYNLFDSSIFGCLSGLPSLLSLGLRGSNFLGGSIPVSLQNMTTLQMLDLSNCELNSTVPEWLYGMTTLQSLDISFNNLQGTISGAIDNLTSLTELHLHGNDLEGRIPRSLGNLCSLRVLDLSWNQLNGDISEFLGHNSCIQETLESLDLSGNHLSGQLPDQLAEFKTLSSLDISINFISGPIPVSIRKLSPLRDLDISSNFFNGSIPESLGSFSKLETLDISNNSLQGTISEVHLANLTRLKYFYANQLNQLALQVSRNWIPSFQLHEISMSSCHVGPQFPRWLETQKNLSFLKLSNASISDVIPAWFSSLSLISYLDLSQNQIQNTLPPMSSILYYLDLSDNSLNGFSLLMCRRKVKEMSLRYIDLSRNLFSRELPDCWMKFKKLQVLKLGNNNFKGNMPSSMSSLTSLKYLQLSRNNLSGKIPTVLRNFNNLIVLDLGENKFSGSLPMWMGKSFPGLRLLRLRSNMLSGSIPPKLCLLKSLQILDLAHNNIERTIPKCFGDLNAMVNKPNNSWYFTLDTHFGIRKLIVYFVDNILLVMKDQEYEYSSSILPLATSMDLSCNNLYGEIPTELTRLQGLISLNLSMNKFHGMIPKKIGSMTQLESFDLSMNQLSGEIPKDISNLTFLHILNLSYNNLSGRIPLTIQIQSFSPLSFIGNHDLCGPPLADNCTKNDDHVAPIIPNGSMEEEHDIWIDMKWFYMGLPFGFVVGFWIVLGPLAFNKTLRLAYFQYLDDLKYKVFRFFL
ncbi:receptor-like protein EIX1 [Malania oleifera]|uniref:receptor-like protein EIX1 n=1 Tax=Malania oleifera TaxID=397392 RepID=UPI0025AE7FFD|nr:receptor-like protein EIX1 [Malania oleifera]